MRLLRRIIEQHFHANARKTLRKIATHLASTNDAYRFIENREPLLLRKHHENAEYVFRNTDFVTARSRREEDATLS
ncbi:Uncharacterised protein [Vibrio cholerae]|nr:Uncharacterised protein [Vibrio cholerae]